MFRGPGFEQCIAAPRMLSFGRKLIDSALAALGAPWK
jgi:hypothetical protein